MCESLGLLNAEELNEDGCRGLLVAMVENCSDDAELYQNIWNTVPVTEGQRTYLSHKRALAAQAARFMAGDGLSKVLSYFYNADTDECRKAFFRRFPHVAKLAGRNQYV